jgi:hypothetical protein
MSGRRLQTVVVLALGFVLGAIVVGGAVAARYVTGGDTEVTSIKLTGGGLPDLGASSTYGVAELATTIRDYHDSGRYDSELATVDAHAKRSLTNQLRRLQQSPGPGRYSECAKKGGDCHQVKPAIVLDIDETSLSNYTGLNASNFSSAGLVPGAVAGTDPVIGPTLELYRLARERGVEAFFITGRPDAVRGPTESNLQAAGYDQGYTLTTKPSGLETIEYKSGERARIEEELGFTILVNVGDQDSDLAGGHARRAFKLPNPMYFIP